MTTKNFVNQAYDLLEDFDTSVTVDDEIVLDPVEEDEVKEEPTLDSLEDRVEKLEEIVYNQDTSDETGSEELGSVEKFHNKVKDEFKRISKISDDTEITEELLEGTAYKKAFIPHVANRNNLTSDEVRDIILGR